MSGATGDWAPGFALRTEVPCVSEGLIDVADQGPMPFIVLGDFNCRFNGSPDQVWGRAG